MTIDEAIKQCLEVADDLTKQADTADDAMILDGFNVDDCRQYIANLRQLVEWLTELKEWRANPFYQIKTECKNNYYCNKCAFLDHCPFSNGNRVAAEYPMDWVVY